MSSKPGTGHFSSLKTERLVRKTFRTRDEIRAEVFGSNCCKLASDREGGCHVSGLGQRLGAFLDQSRAVVDQPAVNLHQRRAGIDFGARLGGRIDSAGSDDWQLSG